MSLTWPHHFRTFLLRLFWLMDTHSKRQKYTSILNCLPKLLRQNNIWEHPMKCWFLIFRGGISVTSLTSRILWVSCNRSFNLILQFSQTCHRLTLCIKDNKYISKWARTQLINSSKCLNLNTPSTILTWVNLSNTECLNSSKWLNQILLLHP